jgi:hypothetical protein
MSLDEGKRERSLLSPELAAGLSVALVVTYKQISGQPCRSDSEASRQDIKHTSR